MGISTTETGQILWSDQRSHGLQVKVERHNRLKYRSPKRSSSFLEIDAWYSVMEKARTVVQPQTTVITMPSRRPTIISVQLLPLCSYFNPRSSPSISRCCNQSKTFHLALYRIVASSHRHIVVLTWRIHNSWSAKYFFSYLCLDSAFAAAWPLSWNRNWRLWYARSVWRLGEALSIVASRSTTVQIRIRNMCHSNRRIDLRESKEDILWMHECLCS